MASTRASSLLFACLAALPLLAPAPAQARAWQGLEPAVRADQPWAGHLLVAPLSVNGRLPHRFGGGS